MKRRSFVASCLALLGIGEARSAFASDSLSLRFVATFRLGGGKLYTATWDSKEDLLDVFPHLSSFDEPDGLMLVPAGVTGDVPKRIRILATGDEVGRNCVANYEEKIKEVVNEWSPQRGEILMLGNSCSVVVV